MQAGNKPPFVKPKAMILHCQPIPRL